MKDSKKGKNSHYKKIGMKRGFRIAVQRFFYVLSLLVFLFVAGLASYDNELFSSHLEHYVDQISNKIGFAIKRVELDEPLNYCTSVKPLLQDMKPGMSIFLVPINSLRERLEEIDCVENASIKRVYPDTIDIVIHEKTPIAIWQNNQQFQYVAESGGLMAIKTLKGLDKFIVITGNNAPIHAADLINMLEINNEVQQEVAAATWVGDRRWNITLKNGTIIMLPEEDPEIAWGKFIKLYRSPAFVDQQTKSFDMRIANRVYVK